MEPDLAAQLDPAMEDLALLNTSHTPRSSTVHETIDLRSISPEIRLMIYRYLDLDFGVLRRRHLRILPLVRAADEAPSAATCGESRHEVLPEVIRQNVNNMSSLDEDFIGELD